MHVITYCKWQIYSRTGLSSSRHRGRNMWCDTELAAPVATISTVSLHLRYPAVCYYAKQYSFFHIATSRVLLVRQPNRRRRFRRDGFPAWLHGVVREHETRAHVRVHRRSILYMPTTAFFWAFAQFNELVGGEPKYIFKNILVSAFISNDGAVEFISNCHHSSLGLSHSSTSLYPSLILQLMPITWFSARIGNYKEQKGPLKK